MRTVTAAALILLFSLVLVLAFPTAVWSHEWYSASCCSGQDCEMIEARHIHHTPEGYRLVLGPGDHKMVRSAIDVTIPYDSSKVRISQDDHYHACIGPYENVICIYVPAPLG